MLTLRKLDREQYHGNDDWGNRVLETRSKPDQNEVKIRISCEMTVQPACFGITKER